MTAELTEAYPEAQREVEATLHAIMDHVRRKDVDGLEQLHLFGPKFTKFDDVEPLDRQDAETCRNLEREGLLGVSEPDFRFQDLKVDVFGSVAIATFVLEQNFKVAADSFSFKSRTTMVFVRAGAGWRITHEHISAFKSNP